MRSLLFVKMFFVRLKLTVWRFLIRKGLIRHKGGFFDFRILNAAGEEVWSLCGVPNALANQGEQDMLNVYLCGGAGPAGFFLRLFNCTPVITSTLATLTGEPSSNGYAAQALNRDASANGWPTLALSAGNYQATSKTVTFIASGGSWGPVTNVSLTTTSDNTGKLIAYAPLSVTRTLEPGDSLQVTYNLLLV